MAVAGGGGDRSVDVSFLDLAAPDSIVLDCQEVGAVPRNTQPLEVNERPLG